MAEFGDANPMELAALGAAAVGADPGGAGQPQGDDDLEIVEQEVFGDGDEAVNAEGAAPVVDAAAPARGRPGNVTPPLGGAPTDSRQPGVGDARLPQSAPLSSRAPPAPQRAIPSPMIYEAWSAKDFAIVVIMVWAGLALPLANAIIAHLGFEETDHARVVAGSPFMELLEALSGFSHNGRGINFGIRSKLSTFYHACRYVCGLADPIVQAPTVINNNYMSPTPPPTTTSASSSGKDPDEVEVTDVVSQGAKTVVKLMTDQEFFDLKKKSVTKMDGEPEMRCRLTKLQATCFNLLIKALLLYVDFAVWVPFGDRNLPRRKFSGMAWGPSGLLQMMEIYGPSC